MDYIKISSSKLKIMLSAQDMEAYGICTASSSLPDLHLRQLLRRLLREAHVHSDFTDENARLYVQMFPCSQGGCELFISRLEDEDRASHTQAPRLPATASSSKALISIDQGIADTVYGFESLGDMIALCRRLRAVGYNHQSKAFMEHESKYYLFLCGFSPSSLYEPDTFCFLNEYGTRQNARQIDRRMGEYGRLICDGDAVQVLGQL